MNPECGSNPGWNFVYNQTGNIVTKLGGTFVTTGYGGGGNKVLQGDWQ